MIYKIYKDTNKGYEAVCVAKDIDDLFIVLDMLIIDDNESKVLVIEHNIEENYDFPKYMYTGNIIEYIEYKDNYYYKHKSR